MLISVQAHHSFVDGIHIGKKDARKGRLAHHMVKASRNLTGMVIFSCWKSLKNGRAVRVTVSREGYRRRTRVIG